jgi:hypothetical protein
MADAADGLRPFLPTADEIGPGFTVGDEPKPDPSTPAICGGPGTVSQFAYAVRVGTAFDRASGPLGHDRHDLHLPGGEGRTDRLPDPLTTTRTGVQKLVGRRETPVMLDRSPA